MSDKKPVIHSLNKQLRKAYGDRVDEREPQLVAYLGGPMAGMPDHNYPTFNAAAAKLRADGWHIVNPAELGGGMIGTALPPEWYLRQELAMIPTCTHILLLPGWRKSRGAIAEYIVADRCRLIAYELNSNYDIIPGSIICRGAELELARFYSDTTG